MKTERELGAKASKAKGAPKGLSPRKGAAKSSDVHHDPGRPLIIVVAALCIVGLVMVLSASSIEALHSTGSSWKFFSRQLVSVLIGGLALFFTAKIDYHFWRKFVVPGVLGVMFLLFLVLIPGLGQSVYGARRWLGAGPLQFQPSELAKLALILFSADLLARHPPESEGPTALYVIGGATVVTVGLVMMQPDMGTTMVIVGGVMAVVILGGIPLVPLAGMIGGVVGIGGLIAVFEPYRRERLLSFADPFAQASGSGYQVVQSLMGLGAGGIRGLGLGASRAKWGFLPNAHTDFIFAIIGEELGLFGGLGVIGLFVALGIYGIRAATRAPDAFGALVAGGVTAWIVGQGALNMATVVGALPVTGVPLPFVSLGGTSTMFAMAAAGIVINIARQGRASTAR